MIVQRTENASAHGHPIIAFVGPERFATVFVLPNKIIVRRGSIQYGIGEQARCYAGDERTKAEASARRYARRHHD